MKFKGFNLTAYWGKGALELSLNELLLVDGEMFEIDALCSQADPSQIGVVLTDLGGGNECSIAPVDVVEASWDGSVHRWDGKDSVRIGPGVEDMHIRVGFPLGKERWAALEAIRKLCDEREDSGKYEPCFLVEIVRLRECDAS